MITESQKVPIFEEGRVTKVLNIIQDITERKKAEGALRKSEKELKKRVKELEEFYDIAVSRELRMVELKKENKELKEELEEYRKRE